MNNSHSVDSSRELGEGLEEKGQTFYPSYGGRSDATLIIYPSTYTFQIVSVTDGVSVTSIHNP